MELRPRGRFERVPLGQVLALSMHVDKRYVLGCLRLVPLVIYQRDSNFEEV